MQALEERNPIAKGVNPWNEKQQSLSKKPSLLQLISIGWRRDGFCLFKRNNNLFRGSQLWLSDIIIT